MKSTFFSSVLYKLFTAIGLTALVLGVLQVTPAYAAALTVTSNADTVAVDGQCTLREAIANANNDAATNADCAAGAGNDTISFSSGMTITLGSSLPNITDVDGLTINGGGNVTISGNNSVRILTVSGVPLTLQNITLTAGNGNNGNGGAIDNNGGTLTVTSSTFSSNSTTGAGDNGGAIYNRATGTLSVTSSTFTGNSVSATGNSNGGAIYMASGTVTLTNSTFTGNSATLNGGAVAVAAGTLTVTGSSFSSNTADEGGAIYHNAGTLLTVSNSAFTSNQANGSGIGDAGAIYLDNNASSATISGSTFSNNSADDDAGAIYNDSEPFTITNSTFSGNVANGLRGDGTIGGALYNSGNAGTTTITLSTFSNNIAQTALANGAFGGGVYNSGAALVVANVTFTGNSVQNTFGSNNAQGGGFWTNAAANLYNVTFSGNSTSETGTGFANGGNLFGTATFNNTIFANGTANAAANNCGGVFTNSGNNIDYNGGNNCGVSFSNANPSLGALTGSPAYFPLTFGSPAIDAGDNTVCGNASVNNLSQNGVSRPQPAGGTCDIGSFEYVNQPPTVTTPIADVNVFEDAANTVFSLYPNFGDIENADAQLTYTVTGNTNPGLFTTVDITNPASFTLDYAPDANGTSDITIRATDTGGLYVEDTFTVTVTAVNDKPDFTAADPAAVNEDAGAQSVAGWVTAVDFGPADEDASQSVLGYIVSNNTCGTLLSAGPAVDTTGTLTFTPAANQSGTCAFDVQVQDNGGTANNGIDTSVAHNFTITVNAVDDAPVAVNDSATLNEDAVATTIDVLANDTDIDGGPKAINSVTQPANGTVVITNAGADLTYQPNADYCNDSITTDDFTYTLNGGSTATVAVIVNCANDAPVNSVPGSQATTVNTPLIFNAGNGNLISVSDVDAGTGTIQVTLTVTNGTISLSGTTGLSFVVGSGTGDTTMTFTGTLNDLNNAINGLTFDPTTNYIGSAQLQITTNDLGLTGTGGNQTDTDVINITINGIAPTITSSLPSAGTVGSAYSHTFTATGFPAPTFSLTGTLPPGLTFDGVDTISGTPTSGGVFGGLIVTATNGIVPDDTQNFSITINAPTIALAPASLPNGTLTVAYSQTITASGGTAPYSFTFTGTLPPGLTLSSTGVLSGTPTAIGTFNFTVTATDSSTGTGPYTGGQAYSVTINVNTLVTIDQAVGQADPTNTSPINFTVVFNEAVTGFATGDVSFTGSTVGGTLTGTVTEITPNDGTTYNVAVTGMTSNGVVVATIPAGVATGAATSNDASTSTDNAVTYDAVNPTVVSTTLLASYTGTGPGSFVATFSKDVNDPAGNTGKDDVTNPANYLLVNKGANGIANTATCAGGVTTDDAQVTVTGVSYDNVTFQATVTLASAMPVGSYRLFICGTTSIVDLVGNHLNGGTDYIFDFIVRAPQGGNNNNGSTTLNSLLPATGFRQDKVTTLPVQPADKLYASTDLWLEIPKLGVKMSIVGVPSTKNGWDVTWLDQKAGWLNGSAFPTWSGNSVLTGHVWDALNQPGPFAQLKSLKYGDQVKIHAFGLVYTFEITETTVVYPSGTATVFKHADKPVITLVTCEDYKEASQTYSYRRMVRAALVSVAKEK